MTLPGTSPVKPDGRPLSLMYDPMGSKGASVTAGPGTGNADEH